MKRKLSMFGLAGILAMTSFVGAQNQPVDPNQAPADPGLIELREPDGGMQVGVLRLSVTVTPAEGVDGPGLEDVEMAIDSVPAEKWLSPGVTLKQVFYPGKTRTGGPRLIIQPAAFGIAGKELKSSMASDMAD